MTTTPTPTPLHPVATTQAGELPKLPECIWHAFCTKCGKSDDFQCEPGSYICGCGYARLITQSKMYTAEQMDAHALAAIEKQASHSAAEWVCIKCGSDCPDPFAIDKTCACGNDTFRLRDKRPSHSAAADAVPVAYWPHVKALQDILEYLKGFPDSRCAPEIKAICREALAVPRPPTAPAATTPAASESIGDSADFWAEVSYVRLLKGEFNQNKRATEHLVPFIDKWHRAHTAAQVAANKPAEDKESLKAIAFRCPEINMSNYGQDEVDALQAWAFEIIDAIADVSSKPAAASGEVFGQKVTDLIHEIRKSKSLAWRDSLVEQLIDLIEPLPEATPQHQVQAGGDARPTAVMAGGLSKSEAYTLRRLIECAEELDKRPRPMCRDCADENGTCQNGGLECDMRKLFADARTLLARLTAVGAA